MFQKLLSYKNRRQLYVLLLQSLIKEKLDEEEAFRSRAAVAAAKRPHRDRKNKGKHEMSPPSPPEVGSEDAVEPEVTAETQQSPVVNGVILVPVYFFHKSLRFY